MFSLFVTVPSSQEGCLGRLDVIPVVVGAERIIVVVSRATEQTALRGFYTSAAEDIGSTLKTGVVGGVLDSIALSQRSVAD